MHLTRLQNYMVSFRMKLALLMACFLLGTSYIYGIEYYETALSALFDYSLIEGGTFRQYNVPCSVCMSQGRANQVPSISTKIPKFSEE